jgi:hypothetical protein
MAHPHASYTVSVDEILKIGREELARTIQRGASYEINGVRYQSHNLKDLWNLIDTASTVAGTTAQLVRQETFLRGRRG